ncbi:thiol-disulfide isomerase/thioredoxin [Streptomonospora nanhaiensis]|uniref:Thiol-disulfide isomerase/thioredoxin n=1 Tax=Streptomonospora nanhaiensis TaxID=1323731 RepID=A0A853BLG3_9ACTN|nr:TlpA disulfide reductase family protein [Streptomonospora nanhaiensis]NYI96399.1 thiol-disulfide isomerase/thioredoxin [Streptomonospora nanhaiensis]
MPWKTTPARVRSAAAAAALLLLLTGCAGGFGAGGSGADSGSQDNRYIEGDGSSTSFAPDERSPAPEVSGETLEGDPVDLADYRGHVLVVNFWASWCGPCRSETPVLNEVYAEHKDDGLRFLGVNIKDNSTAAAAFQENQEVAYPSLFDQPGAVPQAFRDTVPPAAIPSTLVLDRQGRIAARVIGETGYNELTGLVETVLAEDGGGAGSGDSADSA